MTPERHLVTISPEENASDAMEKLVAKELCIMPVVRHNCEFLGLLLQIDIMHWLQYQNGQAGEPKLPI
jgi:predicted transcriptional regulator